MNKSALIRVVDDDEALLSELLMRFGLKSQFIF